MTVTYILTAAEAAHVLRTVDTDPAMLDLLPLVDAYIKRATGHNWAADTTIAPEAKAAARILLTLWFENPGQMANGQGALPQGLTAALTQLEALVGSILTFTGRNGAGAVQLPGAEIGDQVAGLIGIVGVTGDRRTDFESVITVADQIQQSSASDLSENTYRVRLTSPAAP